MMSMAPYNSSTPAQTTGYSPPVPIMRSNVPMSPMTISSQNIPTQSVMPQPPQPMMPPPPQPMMPPPPQPMIPPSPATPEEIEGINLRPRVKNNQFMDYSN